MARQNPQTAWSRPSTFTERFTQAVQLLCGGTAPDPQAIQAWLDPKSEDNRLQAFAVDHGPRWCQGIELLDAAYRMASNPAEGAEHTPGVAHYVAGLRIRRGEDTQVCKILFTTEDDPRLHADEIASSYYGEEAAVSTDGEYLFNGDTLAVSVGEVQAIDPNTFAVLRQHLTVIQ